MHLSQFLFLKVFDGLDNPFKIFKAESNNYKKYN